MELPHRTGSGGEHLDATLPPHRDRSWLEPVPRVIAFLKRTRTGSQPTLGCGAASRIGAAEREYGRYEVLSWATKYFVDALIHAERLAPTRRRPDPSISCSRDDERAGTGLGARLARP